MANYARWVEAGSEYEQGTHRSAFLKDVRARVRELAGRGYVDPTGASLGFVLGFIPNESIYAFVHEHDPELLDVGLAQGVVLCSPLSLFAVLAVVRQAVEAFAVESTATEIVSVLGDFTGQWERFCGSLDRLGRAVDGVERAYGEVAGTRRRVSSAPSPASRSFVGVGRRVPTDGATRSTSCTWSPIGHRRAGRRRPSPEVDAGRVSPGPPPSRR